MGKSPKSLTRYEQVIRHKIRFCTPCFGITPEYREAGTEGSTSFMAYLHAIAAGHLEFAVYAVSLLVSALPEELLLIRMRVRSGLVLATGREYSCTCTGPFKYLDTA